MSERDIGREILEGIREIKAHKAGKIDLRTRELREPSSPREIRMKLKLSQAVWTNRDRLRLSSGYPLPGRRPTQLDMGVGLPGDLSRECINQRHILAPHQSRDRRGARPAQGDEGLGQGRGRSLGPGSIPCTPACGWSGCAFRLDPRAQRPGACRRCRGARGWTGAFRMGDDSQRVLLNGSTHSE
jgi:hypothetical protein